MITCSVMIHAHQIAHTSRSKWKKIKYARKQLGEADHKILK
jgi:hypothetical protein